jgi:hypothetical protein
MYPMPDTPEAAIVNESHDGAGSSDHDVPYEFGRRVSYDSLSPFTFRQYARLQILRGRFEKPAPPIESEAMRTDRLLRTLSAPAA